MMKKWHVLTHSEFIIDLAEGMGKGVFISSLILSKIEAQHLTGQTSIKKDQTKGNSQKVLLKYIIQREFVSPN